MKKFCTVILIVVMLICIYPVSAVENASDASVMNGCNTLDSQVTFLGSEKKIENVISAVLYETTTNTLMYCDNADEQLPPSSLVKILTALIAIENGNLTEAVTVREDVLATLPKDAKVVELVVGEVLTVEDLIYCMMVGSGNDAAVVLADHIMGNQQAFVDEMNRYAAELGCTNTNFTNVHGLHDINQYTSARDMARILAYAIQNEEFCLAFGDVYYNVPATNKVNIRYLATDNYLLNDDQVMIYYDERVKGSRTGVANDRTRCLATVAEDDGLTYVSIVMGSESQYEADGYSVKVFGGYDETIQLLNLGFEGYKTAQVLHDGQVMLQSKVQNGDADVSIGTHDSAFSVIPSSVDAEGLEYRYVDQTPLVAPIEKGQKLSSVQVWCYGVCIAQKDLYALNSVKEFIPVTVEENTDRSGFWSIFLYGVGAFLGFGFLGIITISVVRAVNLAKLRQKRQRHRRNRRRSR